jgi:hypothetical protein
MTPSKQKYKNSARISILLPLFRNYRPPGGITVKPVV